MPRNVTLAAVQMDACPAPTDERLRRAEALVERAAAQGAQLVALPELFNLGYAYVPGNYARAETVNGQTVRWMRATAARFGVHLAGSLLLLDDDEIYNTLLLFAPDGRMWRYDKRFPWGWERAYFREGHHPTVAETALGRVGMLICWDTAHPELWADYAGRVDLMLVASCPPNVGDPTYRFPGGAQIAADALGPLMATVRDTAPALFGPMLDEQTAWLGVPALHAAGCGAISTPVPRGAASLLALVPSAPHLARYLPQAGQMQLACPLVRATKIVDASGAHLAETTTDDDAFALATVTLPDGRPQPHVPQPPTRVARFAYLGSDELLPRLMRPLYRAGARRAWGAQMAPGGVPQAATLAGLGALAGLALLFFILRRRS